MKSASGWLLTRICEEMLGQQNVKYKTYAACYGHESSLPSSQQPADFNYHTPHAPVYSLSFRFFKDAFRLCAFATLRTATVGFVMVVFPHGKSRLTLDGFS